MIKKMIYAIALAFTFINNAQVLSEIHSGISNQFPDGWHQFEYGGSHYDVEVKVGKFTQGIITWVDNSKYMGKLEGDIISGKGTFIWPENQRYEGSFKANRRHGKGTMYYSNGSKYYGKWKNNVKHGRGQEYDKDHNLVSDGIWKNDIFVKDKMKKK